MAQADTETEVSQRAVRPPFLMLVLLLAGWGLDFLWPLPFVPAGWPNGWIGGAVFAIGLVIVGVAFRQFRRAGTNIETYKPSHALVDTGLFGVSRNPIYVAAVFPFAGAAIGLDTLWMVIAAVPFFAVMNFYVIPKEEAYLERRFGDAYRAYKTRVRRWL
ncbi:MAG: methyltransferase family protein [Woeseiaceae bacterium]